MTTTTRGAVPPTTLERAHRELEEQGYTVVEDLLDARSVEASRQRLVEQAAGERAAGVAHLDWEGANERVWMLCDFTEENGATLLVPGSHRRPEVIGRDGLPDEQLEVVAATGAAGSALVFDGRIWHGTGRNTTDEPRHGVLSYYCRPFIRQQENPFLVLSDELVASMSEELRARMGWKMWAGLGKTGQGQQTGDVFVERVRTPIRELRADGTPG